MRSKRTLVAVLLLTVIAGVIMMFPARVAYHQLALPGVALGGLTGTVWNGSARDAAVNGVYVSDVEWSLRPLALFTGKLSYDVSANPVSGSFAASVTVGLDQTVVISGLDASLPLQLFAGLAGVPGLSGNASLIFERVEIMDGFAVAASGTITIDKLVVPVVSRDSLGGYDAEIVSQENVLTAIIRDTDGILDVAGSLQVKKDRSFEFLAQVIVTSRTPASIRQRLQLLPAPNARGQQELRLEGIL